MKRYFHDIIIAFEAIQYNKLKSVLTALGIIFGVAAVIAMFAIGNGAQQEILEQIKMVGVNNIVITPILEDLNSNQENQGTNETKEKKKFSPCLSLEDVQSIQQTIKNINNISPEISKNTNLILNGKRLNSKVTGVNSCYFNLFNLNLLLGSHFNPEQEERGLAVCIIGYNVYTRMFNKVNPVGKEIKTGNVWFRVIGVIEKTSTHASEAGLKGALTINDGVFIPTKSMLLRIQNRSLINSKKLQNNRNSGDKNFNQLDKIIVQVKETDQLVPTSEILERMILRRHNNLKDFEIIIPELLLKQQEHTKSIFNIVLGVIAGISLLVGGIGIMNIMFASVLERIREIGVRLSIGAKKNDIVVQFLSEAVMISVSGGLIGVVLGILGSILITKIAGIITIISFSSIFIAFVVSASVGIIFGYYPARNASEKDPIESLRYE